MFLKKLKKQKHKEIKKDKFFNYFNPGFVILVIIVTGFFIYERTTHEHSAPFPIEPESGTVEPESGTVEQQAVKEIVKPEPIIEESKRDIPQEPQRKLDNGLLTATFTDGFSSEAWLDVAQTDLYFDWTGTNLLFPVSFASQEVRAQDFPGLSQSSEEEKNDDILALPKIAELITEKNPRQTTVVKTKDETAYIIGLTQEKAFEVWEYNLAKKETKLLLGKTAEYPGHLALLGRPNKVFVLWASYFTLGYEIDKQGVIKDLTDSFGWRISSDNQVKLYEIDDFVYILNEDGSIIRYNDEISVRIDQEFWFTYQPESLEIIDGYLISQVPNGGTKIYQFEDRGFKLQNTRQVISKKMNFAVKNVGAAQISNLDAGVENSNTQYFLSNDGGVNWQETTPGKIVIFENQDDANDLRWKIVIAPNNGTAKTTPYLSSIHFKYWYRR